MAETFWDKVVGPPGHGIGFDPETLTLLTPGEISVSKVLPINDPMTDKEWDIFLGKVKSSNSEMEDFAKKMKSAGDIFNTQAINFGIKITGITALFTTLSQVMQGFVQMGRAGIAAYLGNNRAQYEREMATREAFFGIPIVGKLARGITGIYENIPGVGGPFGIAADRESALASSDFGMQMASWRNSEVINRNLQQKQYAANLQSTWGSSLSAQAFGVSSGPLGVLNNNETQKIQLQANLQKVTAEQHDLFSKKEKEVTNFWANYTPSEQEHAVIQEKTQKEFDKLLQKVGPGQYASGMMRDEILQRNTREFLDSRRIHQMEIEKAQFDKPVNDAKKNQEEQNLANQGLLRSSVLGGTNTMNVQNAGYMQSAYTQTAIGLSQELNTSVKPVVTMLKNIGMGDIGANYEKSWAINAQAKLNMAAAGTPLEVTPGFFSPSSLPALDTSNDYLQKILTQLETLNNRWQ